MKNMRGTRRQFLLGLAATAAYSVQPRWAIGQAKPARTLLLRASDVGAVADGKTDATRPLIAALSSGQVVDGGGGRFAVSENLVAKGNFKGLVNATLVQTRPEVKGRWTLMVINSNNFVLDNVAVIRGGDGSEHPDRREVNHTGGILVNSCTNFRLTRLRGLAGFEYTRSL